MHKQNFMIFGT